MLEDTSTHSLVITEIALPHSSQRDHHPIRAPGRQAVEPVSEWRVSLVSLEFANLCHNLGIAYGTNSPASSCIEGCRRNELALVGGAPGIHTICPTRFGIWPEKEAGLLAAGGLHRGSGQSGLLTGGRLLAGAERMLGADGAATAVKWTAIRSIVTEPTGFESSWPSRRSGAEPGRRDPASSGKVRFGQR